MNVPNPFIRKSRVRKGTCIFSPKFDGEGNHYGYLNIRYTSMDKIRELILNYNPKLEVTNVS